jgi:hypothetical protein
MPPFLLVELAEACSEQHALLQPHAGAALLEVSPLELLELLPLTVLLVVVVLVLEERAPLLEPPRELLVAGVEVSALLLDPELLLLTELLLVPGAPSSCSQ